MEVFSQATMLSMRKQNEGAEMAKLLLCQLARYRHHL